MPLCVRRRTAFSPGVEAVSTWGSAAAAGRERRRIGRGGDDVQVLDAVGHAPRRAGELDAVGGRVGSERRDQLLADGQRSVKHDPPRRPTLLVGVERRQQRVLGLLAEAPQISDPVPLGGGAQRFERVDPQLVEQATGALGPEARQPGHRHQPRWKLRS